MSKCAYCLQSETTTTFNSREHIMPQFLGIFVPGNPTIKGNLVCDHCNNDVFSPLEANFKEDSHEGLTGQMLNLEGHSSVRLRGNNVKIKFDWGMDDTFFDNIFPFLKLEDNELRAYPTPQIQFKDDDGVHQIFLPEALEKIKKNKRKFLETKERIKKLVKKDIHIFTGADSQEDGVMDEVISLLKDFEIPYKEGNRKFSPIKRGNKTRFDLEYTADKDIGRVIAKIAFNYFLYCLKQDKLEHLAYKNEFDNIRNFVMGSKKLSLKDIVRPANQDAILGDERLINKRFIGHMLTFLIENGYIMATVTFYGQNIYNVLIGVAPKDLISDNFGCGHAFNPFHKRIYNLGKDHKEDFTEEEVKLSFGVFQRI